MQADLNSVYEDMKEEVLGCGTIVSCRSDGEIEEYILTTEKYFEADGSLCQNVIHEGAVFGIVGSHEGYYFKLIGAQPNILFNDVPAADSAVGSTLGSGIKRLSEGDVISLLDENGTVQIIFVFHDKVLKGITWAQLPLDDGKNIVYISRAEEDIDTPEIQLENEKLPLHYAVMKRKNDGWIVEDHSTIFGVFVNNRHVREPRQLKRMDIIRIGHTLFLFMDDVLLYNHMQYDLNQLKIDIRERSVKGFFSKKVLLKDISMDINVGDMVLILGGSGAGKSTFMNAIMGYEKADGKVESGNRDVYRDYDSMKYDIGYVPQQDLLRMEDSVYETLRNAAEMKLPTRTTELEIESRITEVLETFGLENEKKNLVGKLSGGQRKRLSIAVEYISKPALFFLDEPDSGLDGVMARHLMENLRAIADQNKIVIAITHAPDRAMDLFDKVIVLAKSPKNGVGQLAFYGDVNECLAFFDTKSLEGVVKRINRKDEGGEGLADEYIERFAEIRRKGIDQESDT